MRRHAALTCLTIACGLAACDGGAPAPVQPAAPDARSWTVRSRDGRAELVSVPAEVGCRLTSKVGDAVAWQAEACVASSRDLVFLAPEGERFLVLFTAPTESGKSWGLSVAAAAYRRGVASRWLTAEELVGAAHLEAARREAGWLRGAGTEAGPRYTPTGEAVALTVAGGATLTLGFGGEGTPDVRAPPAGAGPAAATAASPAPPQGPPPDSIWVWEDRQGQLHYGRWADLSSQARRNARPVDATVSEVAANRPAVRTASFPTAANGVPSPDIHQGPRLDGLTDGERAQAEQEAKKRAARTQKEDEAGWARQREMAERAWNRSSGVSTDRVNQAEQECTRKGDILECRDRKR